MLVLCISYYIVGVISFVRDCRSIPKDDPVLNKHRRQMDNEPDSKILKETVKLLLFLVFVYIPTWIIRV